MPISDEMVTVLRQLRAGKADVAIAERLGQLSANELVADIRAAYPVLFQERFVGRKHEIGVARAVRFEFSAHKLRDSLLPGVCLLPVLWKCVFVSSYNDVLSEITSVASIHVRPVWNTPHSTLLKLGSGVKFDCTAEGWAVKPLRRRRVTLSDDFLRKRGWKFDVLAPFLAKR